MADIAFLLLIFFLVTTTMDVDKGIYTLLPPITEDIIDAQVNARNVLPVLINSRDELLVKGKPFIVRNLRARAKEFILNYGRDPSSSDSPKKAVISLKNDKGTSYDMYLQVQNELKAAYREIWDTESSKKFSGKKYAELNKNQKNAIRKDFPRKFSEAEPEDISAQE